MTFGLLKSIILHFGILIIFFYGAEIFKKNKRFEIYEIPLEIVDVSDKTVNKVQQKKKVKKKIKKTIFQPPKPKSKPKPPEFVKKEEKSSKSKKPKKKEEVIKKEEKDNKRMSSILKSIEKIKSQKSVDDLKKTKEEEKEEEVKNINLGEKLTLSELDMIKKQFYDCWIVPAGAKNLKDLVVSIKLKLDEDGKVVYAKLINDKSLNDPFFRAAAESALRAVNHPSCKKLKVPQKKYDTWKSLILDFNPSIMFK